MTPAQNGSTIHVAPGTDIVAAQFPWPAAPTTSNPAILAPGVTPMVIVCRPPAMTCPEPPRTFVAKERGTAQITAVRQMCGEARRCVPSVDWTQFEVTVIVG